MIPYYLLIGAAAASCFYSKFIFRDSRHKSFGISVFFMLFMLLLMLRGISCGVDLVNYRLKYKAVISGDLRTLLSGSEEPLYILWEKLVSLVSGDFRVFIALTAVVSVAPVMHFYRKEADKPFLAIVLFLCMGTFSIYFSTLRQVLAMALAVPAWYCAKKRKILPFLAVIAAAVLMHNSAIVMLAIYPLYHVRITKKQLWFIAPAILISAVFNRQILTLLGKLLNIFSDRYTATITDTGSYTMLILFALFAVTTFVIPDSGKMDADTSAMRNILLFVVALQCFAPVNTVAMRMNYYFITFVPVLMTRVLSRSSVRMEEIVKLADVVLTVFFTVYFFYNAYTGADILHVFPYVPFWR